MQRRWAALTLIFPHPTAEPTGKADGHAVCQMVKLKFAVSISARPSASFSLHYLPNYSQPAVLRVAFDQCGEREGFCKVPRKSLFNHGNLETVTLTMDPVRFRDVKLTLQGRVEGPEQDVPGGQKDESIKGKV